ncbi:E3 ubiquitin-protein ligase EL5-like [Phragmites australis]|uniref:E3 ubiquitin-protein ligase EL5-like n=1 Tax=Phragmites australis TaxID=29695 RepID=UPI002D79296B|nr:E3 ubiquitin-protein ligase EL5-like [Phragmites australis]
MASGVSASMALTLAGFCFSVIFIVFVCSRLACALLRRRRARSRRSPALPQYSVASYAFALHAARSAAGVGGGGLHPAAVAAFPTRAFAAAPRGSGASDSSDADSQCVVCLAEYREKDVLRTLPSCGHNFHMACIDMWLEQNSTCPVCRISLRDNPDRTHAAPPPVPSVVISPPSSPQASRSDPCHCLFVSTGHSSRASEVLRHEPDQENQVASRPSVDGANNLPLSEVNSPRENSSQTVRKQVERSTQLGPCK